MANNSSEMNDQEVLRLGRQRLDGATDEWLANHTGRSIEVVQLAWEQCRAALSRNLADDNETLLSDLELRQRSEQCIRLLLHWEETFRMSEQIERSDLLRDDGLADVAVDD